MEREVKTKRRETIKKGKQSKDSEKKGRMKEDGKQKRERGKLRLAGRKAKIS